MLHYSYVDVTWCARGHLLPAGTFQERPGADTTGNRRRSWRRQTAGLGGLALYALHTRLYTGNIKVTYRAQGFIRVKYNFMKKIH